MANFNNRGGGSSSFSNKRDGGGRGSFGGNRSGRPDFGKKPWVDRRNGDRPVEFHKATCAECGNVCEVPFRPVEGKPVYCKECFDRRGGNQSFDRGSDRPRFAKKEFSPRNSASSEFVRNSGSDLVTKQLEAVNIKLERLIKVVEAMTLNPIPPKPESKLEIKTETKKELKEAVAVAVKSPKKKTAKKQTS